jgi:DNA polymerase III alpha subunit (gram-positive type)
MTKEFPCHLDPDNFQVSDFEDPYEAFFWLGYFSGRKRATPCAVATTMEVEEQAPPRPETGVPFCELADFCVFDTETSGLSASDCAIQVAIGFFLADGSAMGFYDKLWKLPPGGKISRGSLRIHKINAAKLDREGLIALPEIQMVHRIFSTMRLRGKKMIAHNTSFDARILKQTAEKHGFAEWDFTADDFFCTMKSATPRCGLVSAKTGRTKGPSNAELYEILTGSKADGPLHDALYDIKVTAKSFKLGSERGWWSI